VIGRRVREQSRIALIIMGPIIVFYPVSSKKKGRMRSILPNGGGTNRLFTPEENPAFYAFPKHWQTILSTHRWSPSDRPASQVWNCSS
jgi:hypothetical protein